MTQKKHKTPNYPRVENSDNDLKLRAQLEKRALYFSGDTASPFIEEPVPGCSLAGTAPEPFICEQENNFKKALKLLLTLDAIINLGKGDSIEADNISDELDLYLGWCACQNKLLSDKEIDLITLDSDYAKK
jgi:hypothetical protein